MRIDNSLIWNMSKCLKWKKMDVLPECYRLPLPGVGLKCPLPSIWTEYRFFYIYISYIECNIYYIHLPCEWLRDTPGCENFFVLKFLHSGGGGYWHGNDDVVDIKRTLASSPPYGLWKRTKIQVINEKWSHEPLCTLNPLGGKTGQACCFTVEQEMAQQRFTRDVCIYLTFTLKLKCNMGFRRKLPM